MLTEDQKNHAIKIYKETGLKTKVAEAMECSTKTIEREQKKDKKFDEAMKESKEIFIERLENEVYERALEGTSKMSDALLMFALKRHRPEYRDRYDVSGKIDANIKIISGIPRPKEEKAGAKGG